MLVSVEIGEVPVLIETLPDSGAQPTGIGGHPERVQDMFERAQAVIEQLAVSVVEIREKITSRTRAPDQIEIQFGIKFTAKGHIVIAGAGMESSLAVKVIYGNQARVEEDGTASDGS